VEGRNLGDRLLAVLIIRASHPGKPAWDIAGRWLQRFTGGSGLAAISFASVDPRAALTEGQGYGDKDHFG